MMKESELQDQNGSSVLRRYFSLSLTKLWGVCEGWMVNRWLWLLRQNGTHFRFIVSGKGVQWRVPPGHGSPALATPELLPVWNSLKRAFPQNSSMMQATDLPFICGRAAFRAAPSLLTVTPNGRKHSLQVSHCHNILVLSHHYDSLFHNYDSLSHHFDFLYRHFKFFLIISGSFFFFFLPQKNYDLFFK